MAPATAGETQTSLPVLVALGPMGPPARLGERQAIAYEMRLTNAFQWPVRLDAVELLGPDDDVPLVRLAAADLGPMVSRPAEAPANALTELALSPGQSLLLLMWVEMPPGLPWPAVVRHRLHWSWQRGPQEPRQVAVFGLPAQPIGSELASWASPLPAGTWLAANGPSRDSEHRRTVAYSHGQATLPQRYAYDWVEVDPQGRLYRGQGHQPSDWVGYGRPVLAMADGVVAHAVDGVDDNTPVGTVPPSAMKVNALCGNGVSLRLPNGRFAVYCHLQKGSVTVRMGQAVRQGQVLGLLGNSGNSDAPHLHLHLSTQPHPMRGEGEPLALRCWRRMGTVERLETAFAEGRVSLQPGPWVRDQGGRMNELMALPDRACP